MSGFDVIVVGAGHNGLTCATLLAKSGRRVLVVEAGGKPGGAAATREFAPGYRVSAPAHLLHSLSPEVARELELERHGLRFAATRMATVALDGEGGALRLSADEGQAARAITLRSAADAGNYPPFMARMRRLAGWLRPLLDAAPPGFGDRPGDLRALAAAGWSMRRLGRAHMRELLRVVGMNVADLLEEEFECDALRGALAVDALLGSFLGPRSPGSVLCWLVRLAGRGDAGLTLPAGGAGALGEAMAASAHAAGVQIRCAARVAAVMVADERACGVRLEDGETVYAPLVVCNADPRQALATLVGPAHLDTGFLNAVHQVRARGVVARLHLALDGAPVFAGVAADAPVARLLVAPSLDYLERAFNPVKYGEFPERPALEIVVPTLADASLAPAGGHVLSANVLYAPDRPRPELPGDARERFADSLLAVLDRHAPGLSRRVVHRELLLPADLEREFGLPGGHWHHAELAFDQFLALRPLAQCGRYRTPLPGLWLCGAGCHPGGDLSGRPGRNAARALIEAGRAA